MKSLIEGLGKALTSVKEQSSQNDKVAQDHERKLAFEHSLQEKRFSRIRPHAEKTFQGLKERTATESQIIAEHMEALEKLLDILRNHPDESFEITTKDNQAPELMDYISNHAELLLTGTTDMSPEARKAFSEAAGDKRQHHFIKAFNENDIDNRLNEMFPRRLVSIFIKWKGEDPLDTKADKSIRIDLSGSSATHKNPLRISASHKTFKASSGASVLNEKSFANAIAFITSWATQVSPSFASTLTEEIAALKRAEEDKQRHISAYGNTRFLDRDPEDLKGRREDLDERLEILRKRHNIAPPAPKPSS